MPLCGIVPIVEEVVSFLPSRMCHYPPLRKYVVVRGQHLQEGTTGEESKRESVFAPASNLFADIYIILSMLSEHERTCGMLTLLLVWCDTAACNL